MLFSKLLPKEGNFFELFNRHADQIILAAQAFGNLVENYADPFLREKYTKDVDKAEKAADHITHEVNRLLHTTFITPIGREQIHGLIDAMDDVADLLQDIAEAMYLYDVKHMTDHIVRLTELSIECCYKVQTAVNLLDRISQQKMAQQALRLCDEIAELESDADRAMRRAISQLFRSESDVRELIKLRTIYDSLEAITDRCEDVANQIEGVVLQNS